MCIFFYGFLSIINYIQGYIYSRPPKKIYLLCIFCGRLKLMSGKWLVLCVFEWEN